MLPDVIESLGLTDPWTYLLVFLAVSLLMLWRLEAMLDHGLEGTALGTLVMPYCSGLGNILFVFIVLRQHGPAQEVVTNCLVNNVTNLTLLLGLPALVWGLAVVSSGATEPASSGRKRSAGRNSRGDGEIGAQLNRLSLMLTLAAAAFFAGATWLLARDGRLSRSDGLLLIGLFLFWQTFQVFDVLKHNTQRRAGFGPMFYVDVVLTLACAWVMYESLEWLVQWVVARPHGPVSAEHLGWLSGWLMVTPNALLAIYWAWKGRADIVYASQVGDGHICLPLCLGLLAVVSPVQVPPFFEQGLWVLLGATGVHLLFLLVVGGLPRWLGGLLLGAYGWFVWTGLLA